jgi:hypothetical protein
MKTPCEGDFCGRVIERDGSCIITRADLDECDVVHIIPKGKGDAVRSLLFHVVPILI